MRIGVDACCWSNRRGFGRFTRELLRALIAIDQKNDYSFFADNETAAQSQFPEGVNEVVASTLVSPTEAASASGRRSLKDLWALSRKVLTQDLDIFFFPAVYSYFPILNRTKIIVTVHDLIADNHPDLIFPKKKLKFFWKSKQYLAIKQADLILTVSEFSKQQIAQYFNLPESRLRVIPEGPNAAFPSHFEKKEISDILDRYGIKPRERFLLYVGGLSPHKNLKTLIRVYDRLSKNQFFSDIKLVLVGDYENDSFYSGYPALKQQVKHLQLEDKIIFTGYIEDRQLACLYHTATLFVFPSLEEGFGLPAVEAMACGTPVAASHTGSLPEVLGEAGRFFDPYNADQMLDVITRVLSDESIREEMIRCGLMRAKQYTWEIAARKTLSVFNELLTQ